MRRLSLTLLTLALIATSGCSVTGLDASRLIPGLEGATEVYTLTNLHPDEPRPVLYAANYQRGGLIPVCSRVTIVSLSKSKLTFRLESNGRNYEYGYHKSAIEPLPQHLAHYFGTECPEKEIAKLGELDRRNIANGTVEFGMSKRGVVYALGYPPPSTTHSLDLDKWRYWRNRFRSFMVEFDRNGRVIKTGYDR